MVRPPKKSKGQRKKTRQNADPNSRPESPEVSFDPDPPVADVDVDDTPGSDEDDSLVFDTARVPDVALNSTIQTIEKGAAGCQTPTPPPHRPPRRPLPPPPPEFSDGWSRPALVRYFARRPGQRSRIAGFPMNIIEPLLTLYRKQFRVAPESEEGTPEAQARRERALRMCPSNSLEENQQRQLQARQLFIRSPLFIRIVQFLHTFIVRINAFRQQRAGQEAQARVEDGNGNIEAQQNNNENIEEENIRNEAIEEEQHDSSLD